MKGKKSKTDEDDDRTTAGILEMDHKEAFLSVKTVESIANKFNVNISLGDKKELPISATDAATKIKQHPQYVRKTWMKARQDMFGLKASSAGSRLPDEGLISSALVGYLAKSANLL